MGDTGNIGFSRDKKGDVGNQNRFLISTCECGIRRNILEVVEGMGGSDCFWMCLAVCGVCGDSECFLVHT